MRAITCKRCGKIFGTDDNNRKYCEDCSKTAYKHKALKIDKESPVDSSALQNGVVRCTGKVARKCIYGGTCGGYPCCNYILIEGTRRACPPNMCDKFVEGDKLEAML